jgi:hypothetical protein
MNSNIFTPLNLDQTIPDKALQTSKKTAKFCAINENQIKKAYDTNSSIKWAGEGFLSTPYNAVKVSNNVLN